MLTLSRGDNSKSGKSGHAKQDRKIFISLAMLGAFCLFLAAIEYMIPKPLPFLRIGISNLPLMLALTILPFSSFMLLVCIKVFGQALLTGTLFSYIFLFSVIGSFLSALLMFFLRRVLADKISFIGIGTAGAMVSNISQLSLAYFLIFRENIIYIAPVFLAAGLISGIMMGCFCEAFVRKSQWYNGNFKAVKDTGKKDIQTIENKSIRVRSCSFAVNFYNGSLSAKALFITGLLIMPALFFNPSTELRAAQFLFFWFLALLCGRRTNPLITICAIVFIVMFNLIVPHGRVLYSIGVFQITSGALTAGIHRAVTLAALIMLSKVTIRHDLKLPGTFGEILGESMRIFAAIISRKNRITGRNVFTEIDKLMLELSEMKMPQTESQKTGTKLAGYIALVIIVLLSWSPWVKVFPYTLLSFCLL